MVNEDLTEEQRRLRDQYETNLGHWQAALEHLFEYDSEYVERFAEVAGRARTEAELDRKIRELVLLGIYATSTTLDEERIRAHVRRALDEGATAAEIVKVFELVSLVGIHSLTDGTDRLAQQVERELTPEEIERLRDAYEDARGQGHWTERWENIATFDEELLDAYRRLSSHVIREGPLTRKERELILVGMDVAVTHLFTPGIDTHVRDALENGATPDEVFEVFELAFTQGATSLERGMPILVDELERRK